VKVKVDQVIRSKRRTFAIQVHRDGKVIVRAPLRASDRDIERIITARAGWILDKQQEQHQKNAAHPPRRFQTGETLLYLGASYPLKIVVAARPAVQLENGHFLLSQAAQSSAREVFERWYRAQAREWLTARCESLARQFNLKYTRLRISGARTRWGSCSSRGTLSFTWRLVMAPPQVIDSVVVHELAHLVVHNHSADFYRLVRQMLPDYDRLNAWLKENSRRLSL
jgi:hypothetical protein